VYDLAGFTVATECPQYTFTSQTGSGDILIGASENTGLQRLLIH
jgi:hypothetical protein